MSSKNDWLKREREAGTEAGAEPVRTGLDYPGAQRGVSPKPGPGRSRGSILSPGGLCSLGTSPREEGSPPWGQPGLAGQGHSWPCPGLGIVLPQREVGWGLPFPPVLLGWSWRICPRALWLTALGTGLFLPGLGQGVGYRAAHLGPLMNTGLPPALGAGASCSWRAGSAPLTRTNVLGTSLEVWEMGHCWPPAPSPLSPPLSRATVHTLVPNGCCSSASKPWPCCLCCFYLGGAQTQGCVGLRSRTVRPTPWEMAVRMAIVDTCHVDAAGGEVLPAPCSVREGA